MSINNLPGAIWPILFGAIYAGLQIFVSTQWPEAPPATVLGIMTGLGVAMGAVKVLWPTPTVPLQDDASTPRGVAASAAPMPAQQESKVVRFLI